MSRPIPLQPFPELDLPLAGGGRFGLSDCKPMLLTLIVVYRGYHCPICKGQISELASRLKELNDLGVEVAAISMDTEERANKAKIEWDLAALPVAYGLSEMQARALGLYITSALGEIEPYRFSEPGLFLVQPDGKLFGAAVQSMPFTRPPLDELINALKFIDKVGYPPRGTVAEDELA